MPSLTNKYIAFVFLIFLLPSIPLITIILYRLSMWFHKSFLSLQWFTSYLSFRSSAVAIQTHLSLPHFITPVASHKALFSSQFFSISTLPLAILSSVLPLYHTDYARDTNFISFNQKKTLSAISDQLIVSLYLGSHQTTKLLIHQKLKFLLLVFRSKYLK